MHCVLPFFFLLFTVSCSLLDFGGEIISAGIDKKLEKKIERIMETKDRENTMARPPEIRREPNRRNQRTRHGHGRKRYADKKAGNAHQTHGKSTKNREKLNDHRVPIHPIRSYPRGTEGKHHGTKFQCHYETQGGVLRKVCKALEE